MVRLTHLLFFFLFPLVSVTRINENRSVKMIGDMTGLWLWHTRDIRDIKRGTREKLSSSGPGPGPRSGPGQVPGQVQKVQGLRTKDLDLG